MPPRTVPARPTPTAVALCPDEGPGDERLRVDVHLRPGEGSTLARDVAAGLGRRPYRLPPKHFYDARGARLFDAICDTPEYYLTRAEAGLLERAAGAIIATARPSDLVELGSGAARKTRLLLDALVRATTAPRYVPFDVSEAMLRASAAELLSRYPTLRVHGVVGDYERHLDALPAGGRRLLIFLGSTLGNLEPDAAPTFLRAIACALRPGDWFLLGVDLVKDVAVLERAYNDAAGLTAAFNRNILAVINRQLGGTFDPDAFEHVAFYNAAAQQIEMHLRARCTYAARVAALGLEVPFARGEQVHTEISRKFTRDDVETLLTEAGFALHRWDEAAAPSFGLALARVEW